MSRKVALLIGVSQYGEGLSPLSAAPNDVAAVRRVLENPNMAGFDQVEVLIDPGLVEMQDAILQLFANCEREDLLLLYFSGHGITDDGNRLYLASQQTSKDNFRARAVPASFIQQESMNCYTRRQVIILDCCYSGAFKEGWQAKAAGFELGRELGAEGRVVLTSSTATQTSFQQENADLSVYTQYLIEGIETGAADTDQDGKIYVHELHDYAKAKVQAVKPTMKPEILLDREGFNILLSKAPVGDRTLEFRRLVEQYASQGDISRFRRDVLRKQQQEWGLTDEAADAIIHSVLEPFRRRLVNLEKFRTALQEEVNRQFPLAAHLEEDLRDWQRQVLGLADEDVAAIWQQITAEKAADYEVRSQRYGQAVETAVRAGYPFSDATRLELRQLQQSLGLTDEAVSRIAAPIVAPAEAKLEEMRRQAVDKDENVPEQDEKVLEVEPSQDGDIPPPHLNRKQVLQWLGVGGTGLLFTGIMASFRATATEIEELSLMPVDFETVTVDGQGTIVNRVTKQAKIFKEDLGNGISLELVSIPAGTFMMGSPDTEKDRASDEGPQRSVSVPAFAMGQYAVTQAQYQAIMGTNPSKFKGDKRPVEQVSWANAKEFCTRLSKQTGRTYDLPSEAEWEYACRAGTTAPFHFGETLTTALANYDGNYTYRSEAKGQYREETTEVGIFPPNAFGLYDMHGNVWEWCLDHYHNSYQGAPPDARAWLSNYQNASRLLRGGSWIDFPSSCRSAFRLGSRLDYLFDYVGFRVVLRAA